MMMTSDPIADMLTRIRNANTAQHDTVDIPASKIKVAIAGILVDEGFIEKYDIVEDGKIKTCLLYTSIEDTVRKHNDLVGCSRMNGSATCSG